jgi:hypothetical protein
MSRRATHIIGFGEGGGKTPTLAAPCPDPEVTSTADPKVSLTDEDAVARLFDKRRLAHYLGLSIRSLDRAAAMGLLPAPDLVVGRSPRWSPETITRWLKTRPRLQGRGGRRAL